jgi:hypothetical protein
MIMRMRIKKEMTGLRARGRNKVLIFSVKPKIRPPITEPIGFPNPPRTMTTKAIKV